MPSLPLIDDVDVLYMYDGWLGVSAHDAFGVANLKDRIYREGRLKDISGLLT
jgi:hypothetical protein